MVIDTSALPAILFSEPEAADLIRAIAQDGTRLVSAGSILKARIIAQAQNYIGAHQAGRRSIAIRDYDLMGYKRTASVSPAALKTITTGFVARIFYFVWDLELDHDGLEPRHHFSSWTNRLLKTMH